MNTEPLFSMTAMTGAAASTARTVVVGFIEFPWRLFVILMLAFLTGLLPAAAAWVMLGGGVALLVMAAWMAGAAWLFHGRTRNNLQLLNYVALLNKTRAIENQFLLGTSVVEVPRGEWITVIAGSKPNPALATSPRVREDRRRAKDPLRVAEAVFTDPSHSVRAA